MQNKIKTIVYILTITTLLFWALLTFLVTDGGLFSLDSFKQLSLAISLTTFISLLFVKWLWRFKIFKGWFVVQPFLGNKWQGHIYIKNGNKDRSIPIEVIIKQTFVSIKVDINSKWMTSHSIAAAFHEENNFFKLYFSYLAEPSAKFRRKSPIHKGTFCLTIDSDKPRELKGNFWTSKKTTGDILLHKIS